MCVDATCDAAHHFVTMSCSLHAFAPVTRSLSSIFLEDLANSERTLFFSIRLLGPGIMVGSYILPA